MTLTNLKAFETTKKAKLHELTAKIILKEPCKVYNKGSPFYGNTICKLTILDNENHRNFVFAYLNLVDYDTLEKIKQSHYIDKRYLLYCKKKPKRWVLHKWKELSKNETPALIKGSRESRN